MSVAHRRRTLIKGWLNIVGLDLSQKFFGEISEFTPGVFMGVPMLFAFGRYLAFVIVVDRGKSDRLSLLFVILSIHTEHFHQGDPGIFYIEFAVDLSGFGQLRRG